MTVDEKKALNKARVNAVRQAWANEKKLVSEGKCTRQWSNSELAELNSKGRVSGYVGHHMKSVNAYPQHAGNPDNIQFLTPKEHISQAHNNNTKVATNGYYNPQTKTTRQFHGAPQKPVYSLNSNTSQASSHSQTGSYTQNSNRRTAASIHHSSYTAASGLRSVSNQDHASVAHKGTSAYASLVPAATGSTQTGKQSASRSSAQSSASAARSTATSTSANQTSNGSTTKTNSASRNAHHSSDRSNSAHTGNSSGRAVQTMSHSSGRFASVGRSNGKSNTNSM